MSKITSNPSMYHQTFSIKTLYVIQFLFEIFEINANQICNQLDFASVLTFECRIMIVIAFHQLTHKLVQLC